MKFKRLPAELCAPAFPEWNNLLAQNLARRPAAAACIPEPILAALRLRIAEQSAKYTARIIKQARELLPEAGFSSKVGAGWPPHSSPVLMTGHQPVVYHCGLIFKNVALSRFCAAHDALGINVIMDTDEGSAAELLYPQGRDGELSLSRRSIADGGSTFMSQKIVESSRIKEAFGQMSAALQALELAEPRRRADLAGERLGALAGKPAVECHSIFRAAYQPEMNYGEIPFSEAAEQPESQLFFSALIRDFSRLCSTYNASLDDYRTAHKIKNSANPFPNLSLSPQRSELPFWLFDFEGITRRPIFAAQSGASIALSTSEGEVTRCPVNRAAYSRLEMPGHNFLLPRGAMVSVFLRLLCSDLFIHGLGGVKYDAFGDAFITNYFGIPAPAFVLATASRYLFEKEIEQFESAMRIKENLFDICSHTLKYLGRGLFAPNEEETLAALSEARSALLERIRTAASERSLLSRDLKGVNDQIKHLVHSSAAVRGALTRAAATESTLDCWYFREFPFFLLDDRYS